MIHLSRRNAAETKIVSLERNIKTLHVEIEELRAIKIQLEGTVSARLSFLFLVDQSKRIFRLRVQALPIVLKRGPHKGGGEGTTALGNIVDILFLISKLLLLQNEHEKIYKTSKIGSKTSKMGTKLKDWEQT